MDQEQIEYIERTLLKIKEHYKGWVDSYSSNPLDLCQFAYYEGCDVKECCRKLLKEGAPIALGSALVKEGVCDWISVNDRLALQHKSLGALTFDKIATGEWFSDDDQPEEYWPKLRASMSEGEIIVNSFNRLLNI